MPVKGRAILTIGIMIALLTGFAFAHGGETHIMGTVAEISQSTVTITAAGDKKVIVTFDSKTRFEKSGAAATAQDLKVGDRVVIHAKKDGDKVVASEVRFSSGADGPSSNKGTKPK